MTTHTWGTTGTISGLANNQQGNAIAQNLATMVQGGTAPTPTSTGFSSLAGIWWHDTTNNQIKVRDQADTTWMLVGSVDETNKLFTAAASGIAAIQGAVKNLKVDTRSGPVVVTADELVVETTGNTYGVVRGVNLTISTGSSGVNGIDTGTLATNTWYSVWIIYNGTTVAGLLSTSATAPTLPSGYTYKARVGWVRSNATPALYQTLQNGRRVQYVVDGTILAALRQMANGSTGSVWSAVAWSTYAPSTAASLRVAVANGTSQNTQSGAAPNTNYTNPCSNTNPAPIGQMMGGSGGSQGTVVQGDIIPESATNIYYWSNSANCILVIIGWEDNL